MKILYVANQINNHGGVARVTSLKVNYFIEKLGYQVAILTQNNGHLQPFYPFHPSVKFFDHIYVKKGISYLVEYKNFLQRVFVEFAPDIIVVCDNGLKGFLVPYLAKNSVPKLFELHGSRLNFDSKKAQYFSFIAPFFKRIFLKKFSKVVALSDFNAAEWKLENQIIISNPIWFSVNETASVEAKKVLVLTRNSYEKGVDRLLEIWQKIHQKFPDWQLHIYGNGFDNERVNFAKAKKKWKKTVFFNKANSNVIHLYQTSSIYVMTSRVEGFPMTLLEAMNCGLPVVAYDCPIGPRTLLQNQVNGFLVENGDETQFIEKLALLMSQQLLRKEMGKKAHESVQNLQLDSVMQQWKDLFEKLHATN